MSTTLTNGLKLPDKGSVDWYADMQSNYAILDGAVGTVAEHSTQISGKAPLVHTHTKSDVTDLFNSANTWTGNNTFSQTVAIERSTDTGNFLALKNTVAELGSTPASATPVTIAYQDKNNENLGYMGVYYDTDGSSRFRLYVRNKFTSGAPSTSGTVDYAAFQLKLNADQSKEGILRASFRPYDNNAYDLGSSSYQWNNLYAKNYFYNGVAWGLDKANVWSANNKFTDNVSIEKNNSSPTASSDTSLALTGNSQYIFFRTKGSSNYKSYNSFLWGGYLNGVSPYRYGRIRLYRASAMYGETGEETPDTSFSFIDVALHYKWVSLTDNVKFINDGTTNACEPLTNNATDLGTSTNKWKTLNGTNPGALGLPSGDYDPIDTKGWDLTGATGQSYTPTVNGWLFISIQNIAGNYLSIVAGRGAVSVDGTGAQYGLRAMLPVIANESVGITVKTSAIFAARFYPMQGNVS